DVLNGPSLHEQERLRITTSQTLKANEKTKGAYTCRQGTNLCTVCSATTVPYAPQGERWLGSRRQQQKSCYE
ncbi:hypothetical protein, partial [Salmonella enterica]|uniref:hypothetical protein n=1 Tax=Salmonella enterica TaxID=28901 RepID=UPI001F202851